MEPDGRIAPDEIRERAYDLWDRHHRPDGYDLEFWFMAERELRAERKPNLQDDVEAREPSARQDDIQNLIQ